MKTLIFYKAKWYGFQKPQAGSLTAGVLSGVLEQSFPRMACDCREENMAVTRSQHGVPKPPVSTNARFREHHVPSPLPGLSRYPLRAIATCILAARQLRPSWDRQPGESISPLALLCARCHPCCYVWTRCRLPCCVFSAMCAFQAMGLWACVFCDERASCGRPWARIFTNTQTRFSRVCA